MLTFTKFEPDDIALVDAAALAESGHRVRIAAHLSINLQKPIEVASVYVSSVEDAGQKIPEMLRELADHLESDSPFYRLTAGLFDG